MIKSAVHRIRELKWGRAVRAFLAHYIGGLYHRIEDHHVFLLSGGLAFSMFVSIVPLVLIIFYVLGKILESPSLAGEVNTFIERMIPYESYAEFAKDMVFSRVEEFRQYKSVAGIIGLAGLLFASSTLFSSMRTVLDKVYEVKADVSILVGKLRDFGFVLLVLVYFVVSTTIISLWEITKELAERVEFLDGLRFGASEDLIFAVASYILILIAFLIIYYVVPYRRPPKRVILVSAVWASLLWELAKQVFGYYITHFVMLKRIYGTYALLIVVAFWIYYTAIVFIIGAEIGQLFRERRAAKYGGGEPVDEVADAEQI